MIDRPEQAPSTSGSAAGDAVTPGPELRGDVDPPSGVRAIELIGDHALEIVCNADLNVVRVLSPGREAGLSVDITRDGITLRVTGVAMTLASDGPLRIEAEKLELHGRGSLSITSDGDAAIQARGDMHNEARVYNVRANLGNVNIQANDDVKLNGERIKLNT